jgi:hypothetical protein
MKKTQSSTAAATATINPSTTAPTLPIARWNRHSIESPTAISTYPLT